MDTCQRLVYTPGDGNYGHGEPTYSPGATMPCLFRADPKEESNAGAVEMTDGKIWLARDTVLDSKDRIRLTHLHGDALATPLTYEIVKGPTLSYSLLYAALRLVTDGSD